MANIKPTTRFHNATWLYGLYDPRPARLDELRYIGKTISSLCDRLSQHICVAKKDVNRKVTRWILACVRMGLRPEIRPFCVISAELGSRVEVSLITLARSRGCDLLNLTDGGEGTVGYHPTPETLAKLGPAISAALRGKAKSLAHREALSKAKKGVPQPKLSIVRKTWWAEHPGYYDGEKHPMYGRHHSAETRARISISQTGRHKSAETRQKLSAANRGRKRTPEQCKRIGDAHRGLKRTPEQRERLATSHRGLKQSPETIAKRIATMRARGHYHYGALAPETRAKMSISASARYWRDRNAGTGKLQGQKRTP